MITFKPELSWVIIIIIISNCIKSPDAPNNLKKSSYAISKFIFTKAIIRIINSN